MKQLTAAVDGLIELDLSRLDRDELLELVRGLETQRRRLSVVDHSLVAELDQRGTAGQLAARDTKSLLRDVLRLSPREAKACYAAAVDLGPRRTLTGEVVPPLLPAVAAAQAEGVVSPGHARVLRLAGQAAVIPIVLDSTRILAYGQARRTAPLGQRLALAARDQGCCFPDPIPEASAREPA